MGHTTIYKVEQSDKRFAKRIYDLYASKEGAEHICSPTALAYLSAVLRIEKPKRVVEYGAGIGTMTQAVLEHEANVGQLLAYETNDFCLQALEDNIPQELQDRLDIVDDNNKIHEQDQKVDLVIIDGSVTNYSQTVYINEGTICFVEGKREVARNKLNSYLKQRNIHCDFQPHLGGFSLLRFSKTTHHQRGKRTKMHLLKRAKGCYIGSAQSI